jgi:hypothetical protein
MRLLSPGYESAAQDDSVTQEPLPQGVALGRMGGLRANEDIDEAIQSGFSDAAVDTELTQLAASGRLGEAILRCLLLLDAGARGDPHALATAIGTLRKLGLEDTARRAGLQLMLLDRFRG